MSINRKKLGALLCVAAVGIAVASTAGAARQGTPGVTAKSITIGGTFPFSGPASLYATIAYAEQAYFGYINATQGGVNGRKINDITLDDGYNPSTTVTDVKKLVEKDNVFAIVGSLGTQPATATWNYLNQHQVPQTLLATGDAYWGSCLPQSKLPKWCGGAKPWTIGWQPDYPGESRLYAKYILSHQSKPKIGVLMQSDNYGKNYLAGLTAGLGSHKSDIVDVEKYTSGSDPAGIQAHIVKLEQKGVNTLVIFATPAYAIAALATEGGLHWSPLTVLNNVSANRLFMLAAEGKGAMPNGVISTTYIESQTRQANLKGMELAKNIIDATGNNSLINDFNEGDNNIVYGFAAAWTFVDALKHSGKNPTRASFMKALRSLNETGKNANPFVYPGMSVTTSAKQGFPMQQLQFEKWSGTIHDWKTFGSVVKSGH